MSGPVRTQVRGLRAFRDGLLLAVWLLASGWAVADGSAERSAESGAERSADSSAPAGLAGASPERGSGPMADRVTASAFLRDPTGQLRVEDLAAQAFQPYAGVLKLGNANIVTWLRLTVQPVDDDPGPGPHTAAADWVLLIQPTVLQDARVYEPRPGGGWRVQQLGSRFAQSQRLNRELNFVAPVSVAGSGPLTFYVRVHTPSTLVLARLVSAEAARELDARTHGVIGVYAGIGLTVLLLSLTGWFVTREPLWLASSLLDATNLVSPLAQLGFLAKYALPDTANVVNQVFIVTGLVSVAATALFSWVVMVLFGARRWCYAPYVVVICALPVLLLLMAGGRPGDAVAINHLFVLLLSVWGVTAIWFVRPADRALRWMYRGLSLALSGYALFWASALVLNVPPTQISLYPVLPANVFTLGMTLAIAARYTQLRSRALRDAELALLAADQRLVLERSRHEETSGFLGMLVHEVRNPLARIQAMTRRIAGQAPLATPHSAALATIDGCASDINAVLERSVEADQLERGALQARPQAEDAAERLRDWLARHRERERIEAELPATLVATLDAGLWLSMVRNLVENALKYGPPGAPVQLRLHERDELLCVDVANAEGQVGRPDPARLFDKYYRSARTEGITGTGLGLYWVYQLSQRLGGSLQYLPPATPGAGIAGPAAWPAAADGAVVFRLALPLDGSPATP